MRILYGVTGEGLGHVMRARALAARLIASGHRVQLAASGRAFEILSRHGFDVVAIRGLCLRYRGGALDRPRTVLANLGRAPRALARNVDVALFRVRAFDPEAVITDFDSFAYYAGRLLGVPIVSFDHQHVLDRFRHPPEIRDSIRGLAATRAVVRAKTPRCDRFVVTSFFFPEPRDSDAASTTIVGPVVRPEVAGAVPSDGDHVVVYQTARGDRRLVPALRSAARTRFFVYGGDREGDDGNVTFRSFDEARFVADLASASAVVANGGFTTLAEAIWLGKPVLSVPLVGQAEQELNAAWLDRLGLGTRAGALEPGVLRAFLDRAAQGGFERTSDPRFFTGERDVESALRHAFATAEAA